MDWEKLQNAPFKLDRTALKWVQNTLENMTVDQMIGQLFFIELTGMEDAGYLRSVWEMEVGGLVYRSDTGFALREKLLDATKNARIPLLIGGNLESGSGGCLLGGTDMGSQMLLAAGKDREAGYRLGLVCCREAASAGVNCAFAPVVDLDLNFRNPITNTRTYGRNPDTVIDMASGYLKAARECEIAASIKHFPGDGVDEYDQHFTTSENNLDSVQWEASYGKIYRALIGQNALIVMVGHISLPEISHMIDSTIDPHAPATLNPAVLKGLLRDELGFNGMILTDSSNMLSFLTYCSRKTAVPGAIASGCDMFLFNKNLAEDMAYMKAGLEEGVLTPARLKEAVARILAVKAAIGLHKKQRENRLVPHTSVLGHIGAAEHKTWARRIAEEGITLVRDSQEMLPLHPQRYPRLYLNVLQPEDSPATPLRKWCAELLAREGFAVTLQDRKRSRDMSLSMQDNHLGVAWLKERFDAAVYIAAYTTPSNKLSIRLDWTGMHARGYDAPWFIHEIPTLFISVGNPYHLFDVPYIKTYINAYASTETVLSVLMEKLTGRQEFAGTSPVDLCCDRWRVQ